jgi:hypothetical protein
MRAISAFARRGQVAGVDHEKAGAADDHAGIAVRPFIRRVVVLDDVDVFRQAQHPRRCIGGARLYGAGRDG